MPIPYRLDPFGKSNKPTAFELIVKPGILAAGLTYGLTPYWNEGGYCEVDWGDGQKEDAVTSGTGLNHTYAKAGTYAVKVKSDCYRFVPRAASGDGAYVYDCTANWDALGDITDATQMFRYCGKAIFGFNELPKSLKNCSMMFYDCTNATLPLTSLPEGLVLNRITGNYMFNGCANAQLPLTSLPEGVSNGIAMFNGCANAQLPLMKLPDGLTNGQSMFNGCTNAEISLDTLVANAPADGWTGLTNIQKMFYNCTKVTGSRSAFLAKCPNVTNITDAFTGTNTTE